MIGRVLRRIMVAISLMICGVGNCGIIIGDFEYEILSEEEKTAQVCLSPNYNKDIPHLRFPSSVKINGVRYKVTTVGPSYKARERIIEVTLPSSITCISSRAFSSCRLLKDVHIEAELLEEIGGGAFAGCVELKTFDFSKLPLDVDKIGKSVFSGAGVTEVEWPENLVRIPGGMFYGAEVKKVKLPRTLKEIGDYAFCECLQLDSISIPAGVKINDFAFRHCWYLSHIELGEGCDIGNWVFAENVTVEKIKVPSNTTLRGKDLCNNMLNLKEIELDENFTNVNNEEDLTIEDSFNYMQYSTDFYDLPEGYYRLFDQYYYEHMAMYEFEPVYHQEVEKVIYHTSNPQPFSSPLFRRHTREKATLYVEGTDGVKLAKITYPWKLFKNIKPIEISTEVENMECEDLDTNIEVGLRNGYYTLTGVYAGDDPAKLQPGLYIYRLNRNTRKVLIN